MGQVLVKPVPSLSGFESSTQLTDQKRAELSWFLVSATSVHSGLNRSGEISTSIVWFPFSWNGCSNLRRPISAFTFPGKALSVSDY